MIFVTGATGFIGAHLLLELVSQNFRVKALMREKSSLTYFKKLAAFYGISPQILEKIDWVHGDILEPHTLVDAMQDCTTVYHCAGRVSFDPADWDRLLEINRAGTSNLVNAALENGVTRFCYVSTVAAEGIHSQIMTGKHNARLLRRSQPYGYSKYLGELEVCRAREEGMETVIVNPSVVIGPVCPGNPLSDFISRMKKGLKYYPPGGTGYVGARDLARIISGIMAQESPQEAWVISTSNRSFREAMRLFSTVLGKEAPVSPLTAFHFRLLMLSAKAARLLNLRMPISPPAIRSLQKNTFYENPALEIFLPFQPLEASVKDAVLFYQQWS